MYMSEQEYKEALGRAKRALEDGTLSPHTIALLKDIFPELRMSEDEKIRKELLEIFKENKGPIYISLTPQKKSFLIFLLEKKTWSEEDEVMIKVFDSIIRYIVEVVDKDVLERFGTNREELFSWLKSLRPQKQWKPSKEQMLALKNAEGIVGCLTIIGEQLKSLYEDLKKL